MVALITPGRRLGIGHHSISTHNLMFDPHPASVIPFALLLLCIAILPLFAPVFIRAMLGGIKSYVRMERRPLQLAHRELSASNILINDGKAYVVDSGALSLTLAGYDTLCVATNQSLHDSRRAFLNRESSPESDFMLLYILMHSILSCYKHVPDFFRQYMKELREVVDPRTCEGLDVVRTLG